MLGFFYWPPVPGIGYPICIPSFLWENLLFCCGQKTFNSIFFGNKRWHKFVNMQILSYNLVNDSWPLNNTGVRDTDLLCSWRSEYNYSQLSTYMDPQSQSWRLDCCYWTMKCRIGSPKLFCHLGNMTIFRIFSFYGFILEFTCSFICLRFGMQKYRRH